MRSDAAQASLLGRVALPRIERREQDRALAGVCSGIAARLDVDATIVRLAFALLALASGSGIAAYLGAWALLPAARTEEPVGRRRHVVGVALLILSGFLALRGLGLADSLVWPAGLVGAGALLLRRVPTRERFVRPFALGAVAGLVLIALGMVWFVSSSHPFAGGTPLAPSALAIGLVVLVGPWLWRLARERDAERLARIRSDERAEVAARVHDSVLQTLALIQRHAADPRQVATLARREERELRSWLYQGAREREGATLVSALEEAAAEVEQRHGIRVDVVGSGDAPLGEGLAAMVAAAREAMTNAAKFSGADAVSVYAEVREGGAAVFVRDTGSGFDVAAVPSDRRGIAESIQGRMRRHGGGATVTSTPGAGTEVELTMEAE
jgi:signal transduction histidine kinase